MHQKINPSLTLRGGGIGIGSDSRRTATDARRGIRGSTLSRFKPNIPQSPVMLKVSAVGPVKDIQCFHQLYGYQFFLGTPTTGE